MAPIFTLTTDFGVDSPYVAQMKGVMLSLQPRAVIVDVTHSVPPQNVRRGALVLDDVCWRFPVGTLHVAVVDPGVGTQRELVYVEMHGHRFLAPDNGLLSLLVARHAPQRIIALTNREHWADEISNTFHGRDVLAPVAARLSLGLDPAELGSPHTHLKTLGFPQPIAQSRLIVGEVIAADSFGNLITNVTQETLHRLQVPHHDVMIDCRGRSIAGLVATYGVRQPGDVVALVGSSGRLEIAVVNGNANLAFADAFGDGLIDGVGTKVSLTW